jgi:hypothetical protein
MPGTQPSRCKALGRASMPTPSEVPSTMAALPPQPTSSVGIGGKLRIRKGQLAGVDDERYESRGHQTSCVKRFRELAGPAFMLNTPKH